MYAPRTPPEIRTEFVRRYDCSICRIGAVRLHASTLLPFFLFRGCGGNAINNEELAMRN